MSDRLGWMQVMTGSARFSLLEATADAEVRGSTPFAELLGADLAHLLAVSRPDGDRAWKLARIGGARRLKGWAESIEQETLLALAGPTEHVHRHALEGRVLAVVDETVAEVALATARTEAEVRRQLATARILEHALPEVKTALAGGLLDADKAAVLAQAADRLPASTRTDFQALMLQHAQREPLRELKTSSEQAIRDLDPSGQSERHRRAQRRRAVWVSPDVDGNALFSARMSALDAHACLRLIDDHVRITRDTISAAYREQGLETPTTGMLQVDTLLEVFWPGPHANASSVDATPQARAFPTLDDSDGVGAAGSSGPGSSRRSLRAEVQIQVDLHTLAGLADGAVAIDGHPATDLAGLQAFLNHCDDVAFRRLLTEPASGALLDCGRTTYVAPVKLRRFIITRDGHCIWPGCSQPSVHCDLDHAQAWEEGGGTDVDNLNALCRHHHLLKTVAGYGLRRINGEWQVVTPGGQHLPVARGTPALRAPGSSTAETSAPEARAAPDP